MIPSTRANTADSSIQQCKQLEHAAIMPHTRAAYAGKEVEEESKGSFGAVHGSDAPNASSTGFGAVSSNGADAHHTVGSNSSDRDVGSTGGGGPFQPSGPPLAPSMGMLQDTISSMRGAREEIQTVNNNSAEMTQNLFDPYPVSTTCMDDLRQLVLAGSRVGGSTSKDCYGHGSSLNEFEQQIARLVGHEAGVFCLDELQCQLMAARIHSDALGNSKRIGLHPASYFRIHSLDAAENIWGFEEVLIGNANRALSANDVLQHLSESEFPLSCIIVEIPQRENGCVTIPWDDLTKISSRCREKGIPLHLDGARLWEAQPHYHRALQEIGCLFDSVSISFHESVNAIGGAMLLGSRKFVQQANIWKRRLGGCVPTLLPYEISARSQLERNYGTFEGRYEKMKKVVSTMTHYFVLTGWPMRFDPPEPHSCTVHVYLLGKRKYLEEAKKAVLREHNILLFRSLKKVPAYKLSELDVPAHHPGDALRSETPSGLTGNEQTAFPQYSHQHADQNQYLRKQNSGWEGSYMPAPGHYQHSQYPQGMMRQSTNYYPYGGTPNPWQEHLQHSAEGQYGECDPSQRTSRGIDSSCVPIEAKPVATGMLSMRANGLSNASSIPRNEASDTLASAAQTGTVPAYVVSPRIPYRMNSNENDDMEPAKRGNSPESLRVSECSKGSGKNKGRPMMRTKQQDNDESIEQALHRQNQLYDFYPEQLKSDPSVGQLSGDELNQIKPSRFEYYFEWTMGGANVPLHENWFIFGWQQYWKYYMELVNKDYGKRERYYSNYSRETSSLETAREYPPNAMGGWQPLQWQGSGEGDHENVKHEEPEGAMVPGPTSSVSASCGERFQRNAAERPNANNGNLPPAIPRGPSYENLQEKTGTAPMPPNVPLRIQTSHALPVEAVHPSHGSASPGTPLLNTSEQKSRQIMEQPSFPMEQWGDQSYGGGISGARRVHEHLYVPPSSRRSTDHMNYGIPPDEARFGLYASPRQSLQPSQQQAVNYSAQSGGIPSGAVQTTPAAKEYSHSGVETSAYPQEAVTSYVTSNVPKTRAQAQKRGATSQQQSTEQQNSESDEHSAPQTRKRAASSRGRRSQSKTAKRAKKTSG
eukprot:gb/GECG01005882.1/.p1 GENE.gb/GECG01005882.1/~~gb/GECG01005882.1/.p1  ORF type:complete len:1097 (+),score=125.58 gb/GECG01005882.1/:1-3291(+)